MDCPRDDVEMTELTEGEQRILFHCGECGGLWLDVYETCESCGGVWLESADFAEEGTSPRTLKAGIVDFFREFSSHRASAGSR